MNSPPPIDSSTSSQNGSEIRPIGFTCTGISRHWADLTRQFPEVTPGSDCFEKAKKSMKELFENPSVIHVGPSHYLDKTIYSLACPICAPLSSEESNSETSSALSTASDTDGSYKFPLYSDDLYSDDSYRYSPYSDDSDSSGQRLSIEEKCEQIWESWQYLKPTYQMCKAQGDGGRFFQEWRRQQAENCDLPALLQVEPRYLENQQQLVNRIYQPTHSDTSAEIFVPWSFGIVPRRPPKIWIDFEYGTL